MNRYRLKMLDTGEKDMNLLCFGFKALPLSKPCW